MNRETCRDLLVFSLLLAFGVIGRWAQPDWNFTPLAAVTAMGGFYFRRWLPAVLLPVGVLAISDLILPSHVSLPVQASVHLMMMLPLVLGRRARQSNGWRRAGWLGACGVAPATAFFIVTNFAVWLFQSDYAASLAGLIDCYFRALPFYRSMLTGDLFYATVLFGSLAATTAPVRKLARATIH